MLISFNIRHGMSYDIEAIRPLTPERKKVLVQHEVGHFIAAGPHMSLEVWKQTKLAILALEADEPCPPLVNLPASGV